MKVFRPPDRFLAAEFPASLHPFRGQVIPTRYSSHHHNKVRSMVKRVPFVDSARNYEMIKTEIDAAYFDVMSHGDLIDRRHLKEFEESLAAFVGTKYAVGLNSGYDSLHMSMRALGIGPGDEVIVPAHTFVAS